MANKIELRGVIVSSNWDMDYMQKYIDKGMIMPESTFRNALKNCDPKEDVELHINSPGGSVFAGNEMVNSLIGWRAATGKNINVTVGSIAASMAAVMLVAAADRVSVHKNSKIMFHGCFGGVEGGEQAMRDEADLLAKINADIKTQLVSKYNLSPDLVDTWFAEGRAGWLNADEAKKIGLATDIIDKDAEKLTVSKNAMNFVQERGLKLAALANDEINMEEDMSKIMELLCGKGMPANADEKAITEFVTGLKTLEQAKADYDEGLNQGTIAATAKIEAVKKAEITDLNKVVTDKTNEVITLKATIEQLAKDKAEAQAKADKVLAGLGAPGDAKTDNKSGKHPFFQAVDELVNTGMGIEAAMLKTQREQPELHKAMLSEARKKHK